MNSIPKQIFSIQVGFIRIGVVVLYSTMLLILSGCFTGQGRVLSEPSPIATDTEGLFIDSYNYDIEWGMIDGRVEPKLSGRLSNLLQIVEQHSENLDSNISCLLSMLDNKNQFAVAHVLLTFLCCQQYNSSDLIWNELRIDDNGMRLFPREDQQKDIQTYWREERFKSRKSETPPMSSKSLR